MEEENKDKTEDTNKKQETEEKTHKMLHKTKEEVEKAIKSLTENGLDKQDVDILGKLIDIHKDIANEKYWKEKEEMYMYGNYGNGSYGNYGDGSYGRRGVKGTGRYSRYRDSGSSYGRRGVPGTGRGRYRGEDMLDEMYEKYQEYNEGREAYNNSGNYGAKDESMESLDKMLKGITEFVMCLKEDADSQEEVQIVDKYIRKMNEM